MCCILLSHPACHKISHLPFLVIQVDIQTKVCTTTGLLDHVLTLPIHVKQDISCMTHIVLLLHKIDFVNWISFAQGLGVAPVTASIPAFRLDFENWLPRAAAHPDLVSIPNSCLKVCWMVPSHLVICCVDCLRQNAITCKNAIQILRAMKYYGICLCQPFAATWAIGNVQAIKQHAFTIEHYAWFAITPPYATTLSEVSVREHVTTCVCKCISQS